MFFTCKERKKERLNFYYRFVMDAKLGPCDDLQELFQRSITTYFFETTDGCPLKKLMSYLEREGWEREGGPGRAIKQSAWRAISAFLWCISATTVNSPTVSPVFCKPPLLKNPIFIFCTLLKIQSLKCPSGYCYTALCLCLCLCVRENRRERRNKPLCRSKVLVWSYLIQAGMF